MIQLNLFHANSVNSNDPLKKNIVMLFKLNFVMLLCIVVNLCERSNSTNYPCANYNFWKSDSLKPPFYHIYLFFIVVHCYYVTPTQ